MNHTSDTSQFAHIFSLGHSHEHSIQRARITALQACVLAMLESEDDLETSERPHVL